MKHLVNILVLIFMSSIALAQKETRTIDSLESVMVKQEGREKVLTMIELSKAFFDFSFDDCVDWGEKAINKSKELGFADLEADATYNLGMFYGDHADNDLAQEYLRKAYSIHSSIGQEKEASNDLWFQAYYEQVMGNVDTAYNLYESVLEMADRNQDSLLIAKALGNMANIQYQLLNFDQAEAGFLKSREIYSSLKDSLTIALIDANLACVNMEWGKTSRAKRLFLDVIPEIEALGDYGLLIMTYKNYGQLFVKDDYNFDSASYYYGKAYSIVEFLEENSIVVPANIKVDLLVEMGNALYNDDNYKEAEDRYMSAFDMAESSSYASGQMMACLGLGLVYSYLSQPSKSLYYLGLIDELESKSGNTIAYSTIKAPLIMNYARLGKYDKMESELKDFKEQYDGLQSENNDIYDRISSLQDEAQWLRSKYETQNNTIEVLQSERNHYRLAFFGLLCMVVAVVAFWVFRRILMHNGNRSK